VHNEQVCSYVLSKLDLFRQAREEVEESWLECWAKYLNTPNTEGNLKASVLKRVGDVETEWRHKLTGAKAYEAVETIVGYLTGATFPNRDWFGVEPMAPHTDDNLQLARLIKKHITNKLDESGFKNQWAVYLRQLVITGTSVIALPWRTEYETGHKHAKLNLGDDYGDSYVQEEYMYSTYDAPSIEVLDVFDCYVDPCVNDPNKGSFIRKLTKSKHQLLALAKDGTYDVEPTDIVNMKGDYGAGYDTSTSRKNTLQTFEGLQTQAWSPTELVELIEYWGDVYDDETGECEYNMVVTLMGDKVIGYEKSPFWCGTPFIIGTYSMTGHSPYGFGGIQPVLGLLHQLDIVTNQRLDNLELAINNMWTLKSDGVLQPDEVYTEPGRVFQVSDHGDLQPLASQAQSWTVTYQEAGLLEQNIDKSFGTGNYISSNQQRSGERVTATEVAAVRDAGGNRLSTVHKHIEETALIPFLGKLFSMVHQFTVEPVNVRVAGEGADEYNYWELEPTDFNMPVKLRPVGSDTVIERKAYVQARLEFVQAVSGLPDVAARLNMDMFLTDLLNHWGFDEPERYLKKDEPQQEQKVMPTPTSGNPLMDAVQSGELPNVGMANALQQQVSADGGMEMMNNLMSGTALAPGTNTQSNQEAMDYASQQQPSGPSGFGGPTGTAGVPPV
jgi:Bacteriophage head to tail connecting protein